MKLINSEEFLLAMDHNIDNYIEENDCDETTVADMRNMIHSTVLYTKKERGHGAFWKWYKHSNEPYCSNCRHILKKNCYGVYELSTYCPNCGYLMEPNFGLKTTMEK